MINLFSQNPISFFIFLVVLLFTITIHEYAHAKMADHLGDPTGRLMGRVSLNPFVHIDLFGLLLLFFVGFGWGKPVPFDPFNLKNPRRDAALISLAGPAVNFIIAIIGSFMLKLFIFYELQNLNIMGSLIVSFIGYLISFNIVLGVFNLLPIAPLDGFKVVGGFLPRARADEWYQLEKYGIFFLLALLLPIGGKSMLEIIMRPMINFVNSLLIPSLSLM